MVISSGAALISVGAVFPYLTVLSNPDQLRDQVIYQQLIRYIGPQNSLQLLLGVTSLFVLVVILSSTIQLFNLWVNGMLAASIGSDLSCEAYRRTLYQPYQFQVQRNSSELITAATVKVQRCVQAINAFLLFITSLGISLGLFAGLIIVDWKISFLVFTLFGGIYLVIATLSRKELIKNSKVLSIASKQLVKSLQEGLGMIRDVILDGSQETYVNMYAKSDRIQRQLTAKISFLSNFPKLAIEAIGLIVIAIFGSWLVIKDGIHDNDVLPLIGTLALCSQRLLPALQRMYHSWASLKGFNADLMAILEMLEQPLISVSNSIKPFNFSNDIVFNSVCFRYTNDSPVVIKSLDFNIKKGECVGFIGGTGSGKSTAVDLLMGLLSPNSGTISIDGLDINDHNFPDRIVSWRSSVAHVPQAIYLADCSLAENIAFGVQEDQIDMERVIWSAQQAKISEYIESLTNSYKTPCGERGVRLSGGQRQRIGLARAFYKKANILVLDEATSALDPETEAAVMESINQMSNDLTTIIIAHRLSTLASCDKIFKLNTGSVEQVLRYEDL